MTKNNSVCVRIRPQPLDRLERVRPFGRFELDRRDADARLVERREHRHRVPVISIRDRARILMRRSVRRNHQQFIELEIPSDRAGDFDVSVVYGSKVPPYAPMRRSVRSMVPGFAQDLVR